MDWSSDRLTGSLGETGESAKSWVGTAKLTGTALFTQTCPPLRNKQAPATYFGFEALRAIVKPVASALD
jgi:hypothetical protein